MSFPPPVSSSNAPQVPVAPVRAAVLPPGFPRPELIQAMAGAQLARPRFDGQAALELPMHPWTKVLADHYDATHGYLVGPGPSPDAVNEALQQSRQYTERQEAAAKREWEIVKARLYPNE